MAHTLKEKINHLVHNPISGGVVLFLSAIIAFVWANIDNHSYHHFWHETSIHIGDIKEQFSFNIISWHHFVNEFLMAIFFLYVGLEIKREFVAGQLSNPKKAILPILAAIGGMLVPALIYIIFNSGTEASHGWGIPMATDIAFSLGVLALLGSRVPLSLKVFLTALAIVDDLGAVVVIAIFYTGEIYLNSLYFGLGAIVFLFIMSRYLKIRTIYPYLILGLLFVWLPFLESGVHSTIAGVLLALVIPGRNKISNKDFNANLKLITNNLDKINTDNKKGVLDSNVVVEYKKINKLSDMANNPAQSLEYILHPIVAFLIMPLFALANAGVYLEGDILSLLTNHIALGVGLGLLAGKVIGVYGFVAVFSLLGIGKLPEGIKLKK